MLVKVERNGQRDYWISRDGRLLAAFTSAAQVRDWLSERGYTLAYRFRATDTGVIGAWRATSA